LHVAYTGNSLLKEICLHDLLGKQILSTKENDIDVSNLNEGIYFAQVKTVEGVITKKFVVQR